MKKDAWIIIANSSLARIFNVESSHSVHEIDTLCHPASRLKGCDLVTDRPGRTFESSNIARHAKEPRMSPQQNEFDHFAEQVAHYLEAAFNENKFKTLYLCAGPHFLGLLRQHLKDHILHAIIEEQAKDLTALSEREIADHFIAHLNAK